MKVVEVSDKMILFNLHNAGLKGSDVKTSNSKVNNAFGENVLNTGVDEKAKDSNNAFENKEHRYEIGIVCDLSKLKNINGNSFAYSEDASKIHNEKDIVTSVYSINSNAEVLKKVDEEAYNIILRYMTKFAGSVNCKKISLKTIYKSFYTALDKIKILKFAFVSEDIKPPKPNTKKDTDAKDNTLNYLLYKIAYTVGIKKH